MHPENLKTGMWVRIVGVKLFDEFDNGEIKYCQSVAKAQSMLCMYGGMPACVVAIQYPFVFLNFPGIGSIMIDQRFSVLDGANDEFIRACAFTPAPSFSEKPEAIEKDKKPSKQKARRKRENDAQE